MPSMLRSSDVITGRSSVREFSPMHMATLSSVNDGPDMLQVVYPRRDSKNVRRQHPRKKGGGRNEDCVDTNEVSSVLALFKLYKEGCSEVIAGTPRIEFTFFLLSFPPRTNLSLLTQRRSRHKPHRQLEDKILVKQTQPGGGEKNDSRSLPRSRHRGDARP